MPSWAWVLIAVGAIALALIVGAAIWSRRRRARLRGRFGPEYDRAVAERGGRRQAEAELAQREAKRERLQIVPLSASARERYLTSWRDLQTRFVDEPSQSVGHADQLVAEVMRERGYPMDEFEQRAADISVDHPGVVENYRAAHRISLAETKGEATTEDLRQALIHYRALFNELLETGDADEKEVNSGVTGRTAAGNGGTDQR